MIIEILIGSKTLKEVFLLVLPSGHIFGATLDSQGVDLLPSEKYALLLHWEWGSGGGAQIDLSQLQKGPSIRLHPKWVLQTKRQVSRDVKTTFREELHHSRAKLHD